MWWNYLWIAAGGALGSMARFGVSEWIVARHASPFPYAVLIVNATGSFVIGVLAATVGPGGRWAASEGVRLFLLVGICGGYTTFSSFSLQTFDLLRKGAPLLAGWNILGSVAVCLGAVALGHSTGQFIGRNP